MAKADKILSPFYELRDLFLGQPEEAYRRIRRDHGLLRIRSGLGETPLHWMSVENAPSVVDSLIALGSEIDSTNNFGSTPLQEAAQLGHTEICRQLLAHGASPCHVNHAGDSVLTSASHLKRHRDLIVDLCRALPPGISEDQMLESSDRLGLWHRDDVVAQTFRDHGLFRPTEDDDD